MQKPISEKITEFRKARGLTQEQLGDKLGVSGQAVSKWEKGESLPDILTLPALCAIFGISTDALLEMPAEAIRDSAMSGFAVYAKKAGVHTALLEAFEATAGKAAPDGQPCTGVRVSLASRFMKLYDPRGLGFVISSSDYLQGLQNFDPEEASAFFSLLCDKTVLRVLRELSIDDPRSQAELLTALGAGNTEEQKTGAEEALSHALFLLMERGIACSDRSDDGRYGYLLAPRHFTLVPALAGFFLSPMNLKNISKSAAKSDGMGMWFERK